MSKHTLEVMAVTAILFLLTACSGGGGGGGGGGSATPVQPPPAPPEPVPELFRVSGTITASSNQAVDGDTNDPDPAVVTRANDSVATAQKIPNPITLGGYVNQPGSGAPGRSRLRGDTDDYFRVELLAGQSITLLVADFEQADADLYLFDARGRFVDSSLALGEVEALTVTTSGEYVINVFAAEGATNYILAIGEQNGATGQGLASYNIVPWQSVIRYRDNAEPEIDSTGPIQGRLKRMGMSERAGGRGRARLMSMRRTLVGDRESVERSGRALDKLERVDDPQQRARLETLLAIKSLQRDPQIEYAEPNYELRAMAVPDDSGYPLQWHYPLIDLPAAWDTTAGSPDVIVAVVDTGILSNHPDLRGQLVPGYDFVSDATSARDGNGIDPNPEDPGDGDGAASGSFHGTHVGGTVAAASNGIGVVGVAYNARVMPLRALGAGGSGTSYDVDQAIRFAAGLPNDSGTVPAQRADIINLSLGGGPFSRSSQELYQQVRAEGVTMVASAGNEASSRPSYPAAYDGVISVAAVDGQRQRASYSNTGSTIDIAAPGGDNGADLNADGYPDGVLSTGGLKTNGDFSYTFLSGTSMAAPHIAGVIALMKTVNPGLGPDDIDLLLIRGALSVDLGAPGRDNEYGHGLINAQRAVFAALDAGGSTPADNPLLTASSSTLSFSSQVDSLELELRNGGRGDLELLEISTGEPWLDVSPLAVGDSGLGLYRVTVDRTGLGTGVYSADIAARSSVNTLAIRVIMSVGGEIAPDVGIIYVLLFAQGTPEPMAQDSAIAQGGRYEFEFNNVPAGEYQVFAGSDADNDLLICDAGEACGAWLTVDQPISIGLESDREDINFPVDYLISIPAIATDELAARRAMNGIEAKPRSE